MSDTPRTDNAVLFAISRGMTLAPLAEFARELERENAELRSLLREAIMDHVSPYDLPETEDYIARVKAALGEDTP